MASMSTLVVNPKAVQRLKGFLSDPMYKEAIEHSASYNTRLCIERKMRLPFLDAQTGVAQNNCYLWMHKRQRMPGENPGQLYKYPSKRWRKKRRQYLINFLRPPPRREVELHETGDQAGTDGVTKIEDDNTDRLMDDSKDSWYKDYEDMSEIPEGVGEIDDPESDFEDYEESYTKRKKKKTPVKRGTKRSDKFDPGTENEKPFYCEVCGARYKTRPGLSYHVTHSHLNQPSAPPEPALVDDENTQGGPPVKITISGGGTGAGVSSLSSNTSLINMNTNSNSNSNSATSSTSGTNAANSASSSMVNSAIMTANLISAPSMAGSTTNIASGAGSASNTALASSTSSGTSGAAGAAAASGAGGSATAAATAAAAANSDALAGLKKFQDSFLSFLKHPESPPNLGQKPASPVAGGKPPAAPSPYCDFCLGDATENKKTKQAEELVSCSDCGRSGHPSCLQFTANMMISVKKYRWQCIECKCCTLCGTSDNDDQLLFCDDCDRGYHMYCLDPPLAEPPEGSWSCHLCIQEFHKK